MSERTTVVGLQDIRAKGVATNTPATLEGQLAAARAEADRLRGELRELVRWVLEWEACEDAADEQHCAREMVTLARALAPDGDRKPLRSLEREVVEAALELYRQSWSGAWVGSGIDPRYTARHRFNDACAAVIQAEAQSGGAAAGKGAGDG